MDHAQIMFPLCDDCAWIMHRWGMKHVRIIHTLSVNWEISSTSPNTLGHFGKYTLPPNTLKCRQIRSNGPPNILECSPDILECPPNTVAHSPNRFKCRQIRPNGRVHLAQHMLEWIFFQKMKRLCSISAMECMWRHLTHSMWKCWHTHVLQHVAHSEQCDPLRIQRKNDLDTATATLQHRQ